MKIFNIKSGEKVNVTSLSVSVDGKPLGSWNFNGTATDDYWYDDNGILRRKFKDCDVEFQNGKSEIWLSDTDNSDVANAFFESKSESVNAK